MTFECQTRISRSWRLPGQGLTWILVFFGCALGCGARLPPGPVETLQAPNCGRVRSTSVVSEVFRPGTETTADATQRAVQDSLVQLVKQSTGSEIAHLARSVGTVSDTRYEHEFQVANYEKIKGRVLDYRIVDIRRQVAGDSQKFWVEIQGRVCADPLVPEPLIVAVGDTGSLSGGARNVLMAALARGLAVEPSMVLADQIARTMYHDIVIGVDVQGPRSTRVDREQEVEAIRANVGEHAVLGVARYATRVALTVTVRATIHEKGAGFTETQDVERDINDSAPVANALVADMEQEGVRRAADGIIVTLSSYLKHHAH